MFPILLAHGALGPFDEIIFLGVVVLFVAMMGVSWLRSRGLPPEVNPSAEDAGRPAETPDRFTLD